MEDWRNRLSAYDFWWTDKERLPDGWTKGAFLGNGVQGVMLYFTGEGEERKLHAELGSHDVYDRRSSRDFWMAKQFDSPRLPVGSLEYPCPGKILDFTMHLSLYDASADLYIRTESMELECMFYVCASMQMIVAEQRRGALSAWKFIPGKAVSPRQSFGLRMGEDSRIDREYKYHPEPRLEEAWAETMQETACIQELDRDWSTITVFQRDVKRGCLFAGICQGQGIETDKVKKSLEREKSRDYRRLHLQWWHEYYPVSGIKIPDTSLEAFYWRQIYKLGCAVREDSRVMDNQGPWLFETPWPGTWWNLNVQLCYWPLYTAGRLSQAASLNHFLMRYKDDLTENVPERYRYDSSGIGTNTTWNLKSGIADPETDNGQQFVELGNLTWALHDCWLYYRMSMDKEMLRTMLYPLLKRSINYYLHFLRKGEDGRLHLPPTSSPEYGELCEDCNYDLSLLRWGCMALLDITETLGIDDEKKEEWMNVCENLTDYPRNETGYMIGKNLPYARTHRHFSHLMMHMPLYLVNRDNSDTWSLVERSINHWFSYRGDILGFSHVGASLLYSAYQKGNEAVEQIRWLLKEHVTFNTMYQEAGPVMETPLAAAECIQQLLLQSWGGKIRVFPAVPDEWESTSFSGFAAQGGFRVSARYEDHRTVWREIESLAGEACIVETGMEEAEVRYDDGRREHVQIKGCVRLDLQIHGKVRLSI